MQEDYTGRICLEIWLEFTGFLIRSSVNFVAGLKSIEIFLN